MSVKQAGEHETIINAFFKKRKSSAAIKIVIIQEEYTQKMVGIFL